MSAERKKFSLARSTTGNQLPPALEAQLRATLNEEQSQAVLDFTGLQLILAGAGTGKTRTLVWRVAALVGSGVPADQILLLTFTRKASQEMLHRVGAILGQGKVHVQGGTFHAWSAQMLRRHGQKVGLGSNFTIADSSDTEDLIGMLRTRLGLGGKDRRFLQKGSLARIYSRHANRGTAIEDILAEEYPRSLEDLPDVLRLQTAFTEWKQLHQVVDYDDLMLKALELLQNDPATLELLRQIHRYILVDEFQDTNQVQAHIVQILAGDTGNLTVVGDECQGIYSFRGADPGSILRFPTENPQTKIHTLTSNYRSTQPILAISNQLMAASRESFGKQLLAAQQNPHPDRPVLAHCQTFEDQALFVAERVRQLQEEGISLDDMAVLFRSSGHSAELELALQRKAIPFRKYGGIRFVEASHIKDLVALLRLVANPRDGISWQRILLLLPGIGTSTAQGIMEQLDQDTQISTVLRDPKHGKRKFGPHLEKLAQWLESAQPDHPPAILLDQALPLARPWIEDHYFDDAPKRLNDLQTLLEISRGYESLEAFLSELSLDPPQHTGTINQSTDADQQLTLSTIHSAKGLEWRVVFVLSLLEGYLPSYFTLRSASQVEEERRLCYVAFTRAQQQLYACLPENAFLTNSKVQELGIPSRFLDDIPEELWDHWDIEN